MCVGVRTYVYMMKWRDGERRGGDERRIKEVGVRSVSKGGLAGCYYYESPA